MQGKPNGPGIYKWRSGANYQGDFADGIKSGSGKWKKNADQPNCNQYEGEFANDCKHGLGVFHWESGNRYHGHYVGDQRDGYGEMYWNDSSVYIGNWKEG